MKRHIVISAVVIGLVGLSGTAWAAHHGGGHAAAHVGHSGGPGKAAHHTPHAPTHMNMPHHSQPNGSGNVHHEAKGGLGHVGNGGASHVGNGGTGHGFNAGMGHASTHGFAGGQGHVAGAHHTSRVHHRTHGMHTLNNNAYHHRGRGYLGGYNNLAWANNQASGLNATSSLTGLSGTGFGGTGAFGSNGLGGNRGPMQQVNNDLAQLNMAARSGNMAAVRRDERALNTAEARLHGGGGALVSGQSRMSNVHHDLHNDWRSQRIDRDQLQLARVHKPASTPASKPKDAAGTGSKPTGKTVGASLTK